MAEETTLTAKYENADWARGDFEEEKAKAVLDAFLGDPKVEGYFKRQVLKVVSWEERRASREKHHFLKKPYANALAGLKEAGFDFQGFEAEVEATAEKYRARGEALEKYEARNEALEKFRH